jgi:hypothetical protein
MSRRALAFAVLAGLCVAGGAATVAVAVLGSRAHERSAARSIAQARQGVQRLLDGGGSLAVFRDVDRRRPSTYGALSVASVVDGRPGRRLAAGSSCSRLAYAAGHGLCLDVNGTQMTVSILDARLRTEHSLDLAGIPSRARVSPDGRWGGITAFVVGHAYAAPGTFSTVATIVDLRTGRRLGDLEHNFRVTVDGAPFTARDRNFWGLTFAADGDTFYATAASGRRTWLIKGSLRARTARAIHENVECPSLSPDGARIAYKKAVGHDPTTWRFHVLDLATGRETALAETRSIDDQLAWLDDGHLLYADAQQTTWIVPSDGSGRPQVWLRNADSATVGAPRAST